MALFSREPEKNAKSQVITAPPSPATSPLPAGATAARANGPAQAEKSAFLDRASKITGKVSFECAARLEGEIDGDISSKDTVTVGETGIVTGQIRAVSAVVAGKVSGDITATKRIEIRPSARIQGNLVAPVLVIHEGAVFEGHCSMQSEGAREERKITVFPKEERLAQAAAGQKQA